MFKTPILFIIYNRPNLTNEVFKQIKKIKPKKLYIAADGPKNCNLAELKKIKNTRLFVKKINWKCKIKYKFRKKNKGIKYAVPDAISWFFKYETRGIILEDDCKPSLTFFKFCEELLIKYRYINKIFSITGTSLIQN